MTLPRNFPGRKHQRRMDALKKLEARWLSLQGMPAQIWRELTALRARVSAGGVHFTKKDRSARGKLRRE